MGNLQLSSGSLFANRFEIDQPAGNGGMGTVYRARDRYSGDIVALKLLHSSGSGGSEDAERFTREAQLLSELRHPGIVSHIAHGQTPDGQRFLAMEWLDGHDLGHRLLSGPLPLRDCLILVTHLADALSIAHQRGIIHRDIKPTNLFLVGGEISRVKILDFGIARRVATSHAMTRTGMVLGTPEYMAPEQARGARDLSPATDLFAIGCVLYESLAGEPPFVADNLAAVLVRILFEEPTPIEQRRPGVPAAVTTLLKRLLTKDPAQRPVDAAALRSELIALGEIGEAGGSFTLASSKPVSHSFAETEQGLLSIVLAAPPEPDAGDLLSEEDRQTTLTGLLAMGVSAEFLANGALLVNIPVTGSATDQAIRAARAALYIKERWPAAAVSVATGRGVIRGRTAVGEVVELAARSLPTGSPSSAQKVTLGVHVDSLSAKLLEGRFIQTPHPSGAMLLGEEREVDASRPLLGKPTPCVGREPELTSLEAQLASCIEDSEARAMLVTAAPGVGKSRLRHELMRRIDKRAEPITRILGRGDLMSAGAPYGMLRDAILKLCGISGSEALPVRQAQLRARIAQHVADKERIVLFIGELCNIPFPDEGAPTLQAARQEPKIMRDCLRRAVTDWLSAECKAAPVLLVLDDLQWGDELTVAALDEALREQASAPLFLLAFARPEVRQSFPRLWHGRGLQEIALKGLSKKACERLIQQVLGKDLAPEVLARAVEHSGGNVLFLEELIRSLAEGKQSGNPETILAMLQARIGRLDAGVRRTIRAAAIFGQTFWEGGVHTVLGLPTSAQEGSEWLAALVAAELIGPQLGSRIADEKEYSFRHALTREAAYALLTESDLVTGHRLAGEFLARADKSDPMRIAEHFSLGKSPEDALKYLILAATQYYDHYEIDKVLDCVKRGQELGAQGEDLGKLLAFQSQVSFYRNDWMNGALCGFQSFQLLPPGTSSWYRIVGPLISIALYTGQKELLLQATEALVSTKPAPDAAILYVNAAKESLMTVFALVGMRSSAETLLANMRTYDNNTVLYKGLYDIGISSYETWLGNRPWLQRQSSFRAVQLCAETGDKYNQWCALGCLAFGETELGAWEFCEQTCQQLFDLATQIGEPLLVGGSRQYQGNYLTTRPEKRGSDEALAVAHSILEASATSALLFGVAQIFLSRIFHARENYTESMSAARQASATFVDLPNQQRLATVCLIKALHAQGVHAEAVALAEEALGQLAAFGPTGHGEVALRLAASEAFQASGDLPRARAELHETLRQIQLRADDITDPLWKTSYLTRNPYCVKAQELAPKWGLAVVIK